MNKQLILTQAKRELWENKVGFVYAPLIVTAVLLLIMAIALIKINSAIEVDGIHLNVHFNNHSVSDKKTYTLTEVIDYVNQNGAKFYSDIIKGAVIANCSLLYITFFIVLLGYAHSSLFDDRKNRDILFWRSMPVSEATNVWVKVAYLLFFMPLVICVLNVVIAIFSVVLATGFFAAHGVSFSVLASSLFKSDAILTLVDATGMSLIHAALLSPVTGFILCASAYAKKSPFLTTSLIPTVLIMMDKIVNYMMGINLHVIDTLYSYGKLFSDARSAFESANAFSMDSATAAGYLLSLIMAVLFINGAIWLRNNRYEI